MMTREERELCLGKMRTAKDQFYYGAVRSGNHAFIEFTGLMHEYIKLCEEAHERGEDFTEMNVHASTHLPLKQHHLAYINEKMGCIYGRGLEQGERA
jgi:hypothetical protein